MTRQHRYELKFLVNEIKLAEIYRWLWSSTSLRVAYPDRCINSLYFDDLKHQSLKDNISGVPYRQKFRMRWYSHAGSTSITDLTLEKKVREGRTGYKESAGLAHLQQDFLTREIRELQAAALPQFVQLGVFESNLGKEIFPALQVNYTRQYFQDMDGIRITVDSDLEFRQPNARDRLFASRPLAFGKKIVEIKFNPELKNKLAELIRPLHLVPQRNSKYLLGMAMSGMAVYF